MPKSKRAGHNPTDKRRRSDLRPWAAYLLGYHSRMVWVWQNFFWRQPDAEGTDANVPLSIEQIKESLVYLAPVANPGSLAEIRHLTERVGKLNETWTIESGRSRHRLREAKRLWEQLAFLADHVLASDSEIRSLYECGVSLGELQLELEEPTEPALASAMKVFIAKIVALGRDQLKTLPELASFARSARGKPIAAQVRTLAKSVGHRVFPRSATTSPAGQAWVLLPVLQRLDDAIQDHLRSPKPQAKRPVQKPRQSHTPPQQPILKVSEVRIPRRRSSGESSTQPVFVPTPRQAKIWEALSGTAKQTKALATACNCGETSLFKKGGLKEMKDAGIVLHKDGVGFYRPDDPPPNAVLLRRQ